MKIQALLTLMSFGLCLACTSSYRHQNNTANASNELRARNEKISIAGYWVSESYINSLKKYKSPKKAQDNSLLLIIPESINENVTIMHNFHDAYDDYAIKKSHSDYEIWESFKIPNNKLEYTIKVISSKEIQIGETILIRINPLRVKDFFRNGEKNEILVQEELLFKGVYLTTEGKKVEFKNNGQLKGLEGYFHYRPESDYYDQGMQVDQLILVKSESNFKWQDLEYYGFKFNFDTLELYKLNCIVFDSTSQNCGEVENGELLYKLWRIE
jgi:hypothetical protein